MSLSEQIDFKTLIQYLSAIALALFYLIYMPWTYLSSDVAGLGVGLEWLYYFSLVLGLLFPMYYAIGQENMSWYCLGLGLIVNSVVWMAIPAIPVNATIAAFMVLITGVLFIVAPFLENRVGNWDLFRNLFHLLKGLFLIIAGLFYANFDVTALIGNTSINHIMPQFIFIGGGIMIAFAVTLFAYGLFNILAMFLGEQIGGFFKDLSKIFYMLMVLVFLLGITFNVSYYVLGAWWTPTFTTSIAFFAGFQLVGLSNLGAILLIILYIYAMGKIAKKFE